MAKANKATGKKEKPEKESKEVKGCFIKAEKLTDLARYVCGVDHGVTPLFSIKVGNAYRLFALGSKLKGVRLLYSYDVPTATGFLIYNPWIEGNETAEIRENPSEGQDFKAFKVPIMELVENVYKETKTAAKDFKAVKKVELKDYRAMVKAMLALADHFNVMPELYSFTYKGERVVGCFDIFNESGMKSFAYAKTGKKESFNYIHYDFSTNSVTLSNTLNEKRQGAARIINIEGFPFF
ncbi:MAG TPA: hypothetical protein VMV00_00990 [Candidatus Baltobacteraceae bacterium]|nr:hypothetical protein [Candidatus Baltobacteraceae bacterium]